MRIREIVVYLYMIVMVLGLTSTTITFRAHQELLLIGFYFLLGVCGVILANWVHSDGKKIEELTAKIDDANKRLSRLEKGLHREITDCESLEKRVNELETRLDEKET